VWPGTIRPPTSLEPDDGHRAVNDLGSVQFRTYESCLLRFWRLGYSTAITSYETLEGDSEELKWARLSGASRFKEWGPINLFLWKGTGRRSGVVRLFRGSRVEIRVAVSIAGGRESAWRLQRARLSRLCQGAETPKEEIGI
jgi:hypothetical protein